MIFKQTLEVLKGTKTQTRRIVKPNERIFGVGIPTVISGGRVKWQAGRTYAVQPKRGATSVGQIEITWIKKERLTTICLYDVACEGVVSLYDGWFSCGVDGVPLAKTPVLAYKNLWDSINTAPGTRWEDNPEVWVISFKVVNNGTEYFTTGGSK